MPQRDSSLLSEYSYELPESLVASTPAKPRDSARLFVYDTKKDQIIFDTFSNIDKYLPTQSLLVLNETKVLPARVSLKKKTGGVVEILFLVNERNVDNPVIRGLPDRNIEMGEALSFESGETVTVLSHDAQYFSFKMDFAPEKFYTLLEKYGTTPIPKYLGESGLTESNLRERYQTVFAKSGASAAAPTASLHFTEELLERLQKEGIETTKVCLDVGLGTFASITKEQLEKGELHSEKFFAPKDSVESIIKAKKDRRCVVAVGTTAMRTIESSAKAIFGGGELSGETRIFIRPPYQFQIADALITNFHLPRTSLMALVDAFLEHKQAKHRILDLYKIAIKNHFRFYSFGDAMLIL